MREARYLVHGWNGRQGFLALWNAIPWSWFVDYFGNVSEFLASKNNSAEIVPGEVCVMTEIHTTIQDELVSWNHDFTVSPSRAYYIQRFRALGFGPSVTYKLPFLSNKQLVTLAGIGANLKRH